MAEPICIDLAGRFGKLYRIGYEEQAAEWLPAERPWLARIACRYGHVGVQGGDRLHAFTRRSAIGARLRRLPFVEGAQGDAEVRIVFHVDHLATVLAVLKPYRRRQGLSEAQRAALDAGRRPFPRRTAVENSAETAPESTQADADSPEDGAGARVRVGPAPWSAKPTMNDDYGHWGVPRAPANVRLVLQGRAG